MTPDLRKKCESLSDHEIGTFINTLRKDFFNTSFPGYYDRILCALETVQNERKIINREDMVSGNIYNTGEN